MKFDWKKSLIKGLKAGAAASGAAAAAEVQATGTIATPTSPIVGAIIGVLKACWNAYKIIKAEKAEK